MDNLYTLVLHGLPNRTPSYLGCKRSIMDDLNRFISERYENENCVGIVAAQQGLGLTTVLVEFAHSFIPGKQISNIFYVSLLSHNRPPFYEIECCRRVSEVVGVSTMETLSLQAAVMALLKFPGQVILLLDDCESIEACRFAAALAGKAQSRRILVVFATHLSPELLGEEIKTKTFELPRMEDEVIAALIVKLAPRRITIKEMLPSRDFCELVVARRPRDEIFNEAVKRFSQTKKVRSLNGNPKLACEFASKIGPNPLNEMAYFSSAWNPPRRTLYREITLKPDYCEEM